MRLPAIPPAWRTALRYALTTVVVVAVGYLFWSALAQNWSEVQAQHLQVNWLMAAAVVVFAIAVPVSGLLWGQIVNRLSPEPRVGAREAMAVHSASWLLKYIPGQVGSLLNKVVWGTRRGLSRTLVVITFIYENVFLQLASIVPGLLILIPAVGIGVFGRNAVTVVLPLLALVPLVAVLDRRIFHRVLSFASRRALKQELPTEYFLPTRSTLLLLAEFVVPRILNGVGFVLVAASFMDVPPAAWLPLGAAYVLAGAIGILAVFVPSGLGVREAVIFVFALQYMTPAQAVLLSLLSRLISTIADAVVALVYAGLRLSLRKDPQP
jgi:uncharacterized membrane protein YbhN (UPF0104 family)